MEKIYVYVFDGTPIFASKSKEKLLREEMQGGTVGSAIRDGDGEIISVLLIR